MRLPTLPRVAVLIALVSLVLIAAAFVAVLQLRGGSVLTSTPAVLTVLGFISIIITNLLLALQAGTNQNGIQVVQAQAADIQEKMNGHLESHVNAAVAEATAETPPPAVNDPTGGAPNAG